MRTFLAAIVCVFTLGACTMGQQAYLDAIVEGGKRTKDAEALLLKQGLCAMSIGSKNRVLTPTERGHAEGLCGGEPSATETGLEAMRALGFIQGMMAR